MIGGMRSLVAFLAGLAACVVLPLAITSVWTDNVVNDTDEYVGTVAPLAEDDHVQEAVAERLAELAVERLGAVAPAAVVEEAARRAVDTELFARAWREANRAAHPQLLEILRDGKGVRDDGEVTLDLAAMTGATLERLGSPVTLEPGDELRFTIARSEDLREARVAYAVVDPAGAWLPIAGVALAALSLLFARHRRLAGTWLAVGAGVALAGFLVVLGIGRAVFADSLPGADRELGGAVFDVVTDGLVTQLGIGIGIAAMAAVAFAVAGSMGKRTKESR
jgi:hypothetical protein